MIEVPPASGGDVVVERGRAASIGTGDSGIASMGEPDVEVVFPEVEYKALDPPRLLQSQEL
jgi:hypothetical protein